MPISIYSTTHITEEVRQVSQPYRTLQISIYSTRPLAIATLVCQGMRVSNFSANAYAQRELFTTFDRLFREKLGASDERVVQFHELLSFLSGLSSYGYTWGLNHSFSD